MDNSSLRCAPPEKHAILVKLAAAGVTGRKRRPVDEINRDLRAAKEVVRRLHRERKSAINGASLEARRRDPEFVKRHHEGIKLGWADPETREVRKERQREAMKKSGWLLPEMTAVQRRRYNLLRQTKSRVDALAGAFAVSAQ